METYGLEKIHELLLIALNEFDRICRKYDIKYSLHGGTLLGAVRNNCFIPWDDDADVSMTRENYLKFYEVIKKENNILALEDSLLWVPRLIMKSEESIVCIDIFIWDYISGKKWEQFFKLNILRAVQGMLKKKIEYEKYGWFHKILLFITQIVGKLFSYNNKLRLYQHISEKWFVGKKECIHRSNDAFKDIAYIFDANYMDEYVDIAFEGRTFMINSRHKEFLVRSYGEDYMTPPPKEQRVSGHTKMLEGMIQENLNFKK